MTQVVRNAFEYYAASTNVPSILCRFRIPVSATIALTILLLLSSIPTVNASSGMAWAGAAESEYGLGSAVQFSPNGDIIASGHASRVMISDAFTHEEIQTFHVDFVVQSVAFTSDARYLLVGMESALSDTPATVVFEYVDGEYMRTKHSEDGVDVDRISISPDDHTFATASESGDIIEWEIDSGIGTILDINRQYSTPHSGHITCLDHSSDGNHLLSGADDGIIILWDRNNQTEVNRWPSDEPITDCSFSNDGSMMSWISGGSLIIRNHDSTQSYFGQYDISANAIQLSYTMDDNEIAILVPLTDSEGSRRIDFIGIDVQPFYDSRTMYVGHKAVMMSLHPTHQSIAIATGSYSVAFYSDSVPQFAEVEGILRLLSDSMEFSTNPKDTDQDDIPDDIDNDDDGDGIIDNFDNICFSDNNCHLRPDSDYIRQFDISINGDDVIILESFYLNSKDSAQIRKLAAISISSNHRVDSQEFANFEHSICSEYNASAIMIGWSTHLQIEGNPFEPRSVQCSIESGLSGTMDSDAGSRIMISWAISGGIQNSVSAPYNITLIAGMPNPISTIAQNVHSFPIHVEIADVRGSTISYDVWNRGDPDLLLQMDLPPASNSNIESIIELLTTYWYAFTLLTIILISGISLLIIRRHNSIDLTDVNGDEFNENMLDDEWEGLVDDAAEWDEEVMQEIYSKKQPMPPAAVSRDIRGSPKPPSAVQRDIAKQRREPKSKKPSRQHKVKLTKNSNSPTSDLQESVEFKQLLTPVKDSKNPEQDDDGGISDAIAFITSESTEKTKRKRPVRRKKPSN